MRMRSSITHLAAALLAALHLGAPAAAVAQQGPPVITGRVTDATNGQPIVAAQINVVGTTLGAQTNQAGEFTIRGAAPGVQRLRALRVGFGEVTQPVTVPATGTVTADIQMRSIAVTLAPVVTTATGEQRRIEVANSVGTVRAAEITQTQVVPSMGELLTARTPGVQVLGGTSTGAGSRVRIRGTSSLSLNNEPIYVIDGIRMESTVNASSIGVGGTQPSRVSDLNPDEIENIEVIRGPSAATLYGTDAANGVVVITTKRGRAGRPQWSAYTEQGVVRDRDLWPAGYFSYGKLAGTGAVTSQCYNFRLANGECTVRDSARTFNAAQVDSLTPIGTGYRQQYGMQVRGGTEMVRYFVAGEWENETGVAQMPSAGRNRLEATGVQIRDEWVNPNELTRASARANLDVALTQRADLTISANYIAQELRRPQTDNNADGWGPTLLANTATGYGYYDPADSFQEENTQAIDRFIGQFGLNTRPTNWMTVRGNFGVDYTGRVDSNLCRLGQCAPRATNREGFKIDNRTGFYQYTADFAAAGTFNLTSDWSTRTTVGAQFFRNLFDRNGATGTRLPPGSTQASDGAVQAAEELTDDTRTLGAYLEQALSWGDKLFLTGALRTDRNSAFGQDFAAVYYPRFSVSYVPTNDAWFPTPGWMNQLRLRLAYGASGRQPNPNDAAQYYTTIASRLSGVELTGVVFNTLGNPDLKPERATEIETGVDVTLWDSRLNAELTYYRKDSRDALVERVLAPSFGITADDRFENLGRVMNTGWEGLVNAQLVDRPALGVDVTFNASYNTNELVSLGGVPPIVGTSTRQVEGYPLNGWWLRPLLGYDDANNDGLISETEIEVGDEVVFRGYSQPRTELSLTTGLDFLNRRLRLQALVDYKGGHKVFNNSERFRCVDASNCAGLSDPNASLWEQARVVAARVHESRTLDGFMEKADYLRFRELSLTATAPERWAARFVRARSLSATLAARNLGFITDYTGMDPEANYGQGDIQNAGYTQPPQSYFTLRLNVGF